MDDLLASLRHALTGRYTVERELGHGGMAFVYLAHDLKHNRDVAIKVLRPELTAALGSERFAREIAISARLTHPNILPLLESGNAEGMLYYVMPYVAGESLRDRLTREAQLPVEEALAIVRQVAGALDYAHGQGVVHRDVKPENVLLAGGSAVVADFGIARAVTAAGGEKLTATGLAVGTPSYMSPEQASGDPRISGRSDVYSLACVLYELLAGEPPFTGATPVAIAARRLRDRVPRLRTVRQTVPESVERAIEKALAVVPADRFPTAGRFVEALTGDATQPGPWVAALNVRRASWAVGAIGVMALAALLIARMSRPPVVPSASLIAVLPFTPSVTDTALQRLGRDLVITVSATLDHVGDVRTVDRFRVLAAARSADAASIDQAAALSRGLGASSFVQGNLVRDGAGVRIDAGIYRTDTHAPLGPNIVIRAPADSLNALSDSMTWGLLRQIWRSGTPPSPSLADVTTRSIPALRDFLDGERAVVADHWSEAVDAYYRAATADTTFWVAAWRCNQARGWLDQGDDTLLTRRYESHQSAFIPRDRVLIEGERTFSTEPSSVHLAHFKRATELFPDEWTVWFLYADHLVHTAAVSGHSKAEGREALVRTVQLNPDLTPAWQHLLIVSLGQDSATAATALATWDRLGGVGELSSRLGYGAGPLFRLAIQSQSAGQRLDQALLDTVARGIAASSAPEGHGAGGLMFLVSGLPASQIALSRLVMQYHANVRFDGPRLRGIALAWAARGAWDSALVAWDAFATAFPNRATALDAYRFATVGAWLGALDSRAAAARRHAAEQYVSGLEGGPAGEERARLAWADGVLAVLRSDTRSVAAAQTAISGVTEPAAAFLSRSLRALAMRGQAGIRAAAESLSSIDRSASDSALFSPARDPYAASTNHLAAGEAWLAAGDTARAIRELTWHEASMGGATDLIAQLFAGPAYYLQAHIEAGQGLRTQALVHYRQFLQRYDRPMPAHRHMVAEAEAALGQLHEEGR